MRPLKAFTKKHIRGTRDLITLSSFPEVQTPLKKYPQARRGGRGFSHKPEGIWFGIGSSWIDWVEHNMPEWASPTILKIDVNFSKIFHIRKDKDLDIFSEKYAYKSDAMKGMWQGDWDAISKDYDGIIHWKHPSGSFRMFSDDPRSIWWGWDVRSGVVWNPAAIKSLNVIGKYDEIKKEYVRQTDPVALAKALGVYKK